MLKMCQIPHRGAKNPPILRPFDTSAKGASSPRVALLNLVTLTTGCRLYLAPTVEVCRSEICYLHISFPGSYSTCSLRSPSIAVSLQSALYCLLLARQCCHHWSTQRVFTASLQLDFVPIWKQNRPIIAKCCILFRFSISNHDFFHTSSSCLFTVLSLLCLDYMLVSGQAMSQHT